MINLTKVNVRLRLKIAGVLYGRINDIIYLTKIVYTLTSFVYISCVRIKTTDQDLDCLNFKQKNILLNRHQIEPIHFQFLF